MYRLKDFIVEKMALIEAYVRTTIPPVHTQPDRTNLHTGLTLILLVSFSLVMIFTIWIFELEQTVVTTFAVVYPSC